jgi:hypothetical protein
LSDKRQQLTSIKSSSYADLMGLGPHRHETQQPAHQPAASASQMRHAASSSYTNLLGLTSQQNNQRRHDFCGPVGVPVAHGHYRAGHSAIEDFGAGAADSFTMGGTAELRNLAHINKQVNENSKAYKAGEAVELGAEIGLGGLSAGLKHFAEKALERKAAAEAAKALGGVASG